jgi:preprotein translocase subunit SecE
LGVQVPRALQGSSSQQWPAIRADREQPEEVVHVSGGNAVRSRDDRRAERTGPVLFYRQVVAELRKVVWPTQQQLVTYFFVVMAFVIFMMALVAGLDLGIGKLIFWLFNGKSQS